MMRAVAVCSMACFAVLCIAGWSLSYSVGEAITLSEPSSLPVSAVSSAESAFIGPPVPEKLGNTAQPADETVGEISSSEESSYVSETSSSASSEIYSSEAEESSVSESESSSESEIEDEPSSEEEEEIENNTSWKWSESDAKHWRDDEDDDDNVLIRPSESSSSLPSSSEEASSEDSSRYDGDVFEEELTVKVNGSLVTMEAYDMICQVVANEMGSSFHEEAMKAQAVAAYTMIVYNNNSGSYPTVGLRTNVASRVEDAVAEVLGEMVYYNGKLAYTVYHSTSAGATTSAEEVWGGAYPYLVSVDSSWDEDAPSYEYTSKITPTNFASLVDRVYGIDLWEYSDDPADWLEIKSYNSGGYVGTVILGGETKGQSGGTYGKKTITGRSIREQLLSYQIRSHCFEYDYDAKNDRIVFTTYGYGHGVGMSQYGAQLMALDGYDYEEILTHYYTGTVVK